MIALALTAVLLLPQATTRDLEQRLDAIVAGEDRLPSLRSVQQDAEAAMQLPSADEVQGWSGRARLRALLPRLDVRFGSQRDLLVRDSIEGLDWARSGQGFGINVAAQWGLSSLVMSEQEPRLHQERLRRAAAIRLARERVTELYFERVQALLTLEEAPSPELLLEAAHLDAQLSALTNGRYRLRGAS